MKRILLAGANGAVGRELLTLLRAQGYIVRTLSRHPETGANSRRADLTVPAELRGVCDGIDVVVSCVGAPLALNLSHRRSFDAVDRVGNLNLLAEARRAGVPRFVYLAAHTSSATRNTRYIQAHEAVVAALAASGLSYSVIRPTGIYTAFAAFLPLARRGFVPVVGSPDIRSNPIHERDVARALAAVVESGPAETVVGGPDELTRRRCAELAFVPLGRQPHILRLPAWFFTLVAFFLRPLQPRLADLMQFIAALGRVDAIAPRVGTLRLADYFVEISPPRGKLAA